MKKTLYLIIISCCLFILSSCSQEKLQPKENDTSIYNEVLVFAKMPSPPKCKTIKDKKEINKIIKFINDAEKKPIKDTNENGWHMMISFKSKDGVKQYSIVGNTLLIDGSKYQVNEEFITELEKMYNEINIKEKNYE
ncbi:MAG: hypothetical protein RSB28_06620 [Oscillospiraceae bacterium]